MQRKSFLTPRTMAIIALLSALACLLMIWDFPIPFAPPFYKIDLSEVPVLIGGFTLGPVAATCIEGLKVLLRLLFKPSDTAYVGELANFLIGVSFVVPASILYLRNKSRKSALLGMVVGTISMTLFGGLFNYFILLPAYSVLYRMPLDTIIEMGTQIVPFIQDKFTFVLLATSPFNLFKGVLIGVIVLLVYKHISTILKKF